MTLPNLFVLGPPRTGTTSLTYWFRATPDVFTSTPKEPAYHVRGEPMQDRVGDRDAYLELFSESASSRYRCDATPWYLSSKTAPASIAEMAPDARLIIGLRNPVDMIASLHTHHRYSDIEAEPDLETAVFSTRAPDPTDFRRSLDYLSVARIGEQIARYREHFPAERMYLLRFEDLSAKPAETFANLLTWLQLQPVELENYEARNPGRQMRSERVGRAADWLTRKQVPRPLRAAGYRLRRANTAYGRPGVPAPVRRRIMDALHHDLQLVERLAGEPVARSWT